MNITIELSPEGIAKACDMLEVVTMFEKLSSSQKKILIDVVRSLASKNQDDAKEERKVTDQVKKATLVALNQLDELDKQFMLGYAAGRSASVEETAAEPVSNQKEKTD